MCVCVCVVCDGDMKIIPLCHPTTRFLLSITLPTKPDLAIFMHKQQYYDYVFQSLPLGFARPIKFCGHVHHFNVSIVNAIVNASTVHSVTTENRSTYKACLVVCYC